MNIWNLMQPQSRRTVRLSFQMIYKSTVTSLHHYLRWKYLAKASPRSGCEVSTVKASPLHTHWIIVGSFRLTSVRSLWTCSAKFFSFSREEVGLLVTVLRIGDMVTVESLNGRMNLATMEAMMNAENRFLGSFFFDNGISSVEGFLRVKCTD